MSQTSSMLFDPNHKVTVLKDDSIMLELPPRTADNFYNHDDEWSQVYGITTHSDLNPIAGTYYNTGSGEFTIVAETGMYDYSIEWEGQTTLKRHRACSVLMICKVKQSNIPHIDDYITYIRVVKL
jgi:hypothetical protein